MTFDKMILTSAKLKSATVNLNTILRPITKDQTDILETFGIVIHTIQQFPNFLKLSRNDITSPMVSACWGWLYASAIFGFPVSYPPFISSTTLRYSQADQALQATGKASQGFLPALPATPRSCLWREMRNRAAIRWVIGE